MYRHIYIYVYIYNNNNTTLRERERERCIYIYRLESLEAQLPFTKYSHKLRRALLQQLHAFDDQNSLLLRSL